MRFDRHNSADGFTLIEVLVALAVVAVTLTSIGSLIAGSVRGTRALDQHLSIVETARAIQTGLPDRDSLKPGSFSGETGGNYWRIDVSPSTAIRLDPSLVTPWIPQAVVISVQSPGGTVLQLNTIRLRRRPQG